MNALRNPKKISLLAVAILFLFTFFNLILDAPRMWSNDAGIEPRTTETMALAIELTTRLDYVFP